MMLKLLLLSVTSVLCLPAAALSSPSPAVGPAYPIAWVEVNLDLAPESRWTEVVQARKSQILQVLDVIKNAIPKTVLPILEDAGDIGEHFWPLDIREEMQGVADILGVPVADVLAMNLYYELNSGCTSIVAERSDGAFFHGRNLDYGIHGLQNITVNVNFTSRGKTLYYGTTYAGYLGLLTGMKPTAFSLSLDERDTKNGTVWDNAFEIIFRGGHSVGFFYRETLETAADFGEALKRLQTTTMDSPSYMILGGAKVGEGAVVTRERESVVDTWLVDSTVGRWFLVETNYDHWVPPPAGDDRRDPANEHMNATSPDTFSDKTMLGVLTQFPNLNSHTTYTAVMSAATGTYYSMTQNTDKK